jgi:hypothetical protein
MKTNKRFSAVRIENGKWNVFDAREQARVWEGDSERNACKFADAKNAKETLRTAKIAKVEPYTERLIYRFTMPLVCRNDAADGIRDTLPIVPFTFCN